VAIKCAVCLTGNQYSRERLRQYELQRLKYYFAVVECDSAQTANHIYEQCDGVEYESSANKFDLRLVCSMLLQVLTE
jgi:hypothetical protein